MRWPVYDHFPTVLNSECAAYLQYHFVEFAVCAYQYHFAGRSLHYYFFERQNADSIGNRRRHPQTFFTSRVIHQ